MYIDIFFLATAMGLMGSIHCVSMCGPIVLGVFQKGISRSAIPYLFYHLGKIVAYITIGLIVGIVGKGIHFFISQQSLSLYTGIFLICYYFLAKCSLLDLSSTSGRIYSHLKSFIESIPFPKHYSLGLINGFLPCGLVYLSAFSAISTGHVAHSVFWMVCFGIGTIPSLSLVLWIAQKTSPAFKSKLESLYRHIPLVIGVLLILRGLNLGIPYLSPEYHPETAHVSKCCTK